MTKTFIQNFELNSKEIENLISKMDLNKDGKIDFQEFLQGTID
jgi:Ca2+-binding EF-hand superfamily protein